MKQSWATEIRRLADAIQQIAPAAARLSVAPLAGREWYELLVHKLLPQASDTPWLVVAVVGGTNIGKSMVFNHLVGEQASAVCPLAAGTRHPVCLVPPGMADRATLERLFEGFELRDWQSPEDALIDCPEHLLFWRSGPAIPESLLVLDTPDVDSDARINWQRADYIRQAADVLVCVLTQQKYNDAAVKQFFRAAAQAGKPVVVVFNQVDLDLDRDVWPQWLATFVEETGAQPEHVYVAPYDRRAANEGKLPFYNVGPLGTDFSTTPSVLRDDLAALHFDSIKRRALRGAVARLVDLHSGVPQWLDEVRRRSDEYQAALEAIHTVQRSQVDWPRLPNSLLAEEMRNWWDQHRSPWTRQIHGTYRWLGQKVIGGLAWLWDPARASRPDELQQFRRRETEAILEGVEKILDQLEQLAEVGNQILAPRLRARLGGAARQQLVAQVRAAHAELPSVDDDYRNFLRGELDKLAQENAKWMSVLRRVDDVAAFARPVVSIALAATGVLLPAGEVLGQTVVAVAGQAVAETATTVVVAGGGEAAVGAASEGVKYAAAQLFKRLQKGYVLRRAQWLSDWLRHALLDDLLTELQQGQQLRRDPAIATIEDALFQLRRLVLADSESPAQSGPPPLPG